MNNNRIAIKLDRIGKVYSIHHEKPTLVERFIHNKRDEHFSALNDVNVTVYKGEKIALVGPNGSGKTTLLKIIAGITTPSTGSVTVCGKIVSLIDLEAGFHPDLSGYQNIFINGELIGMKKKEITRSIKRIIQFADIRQFVDAPLYTYSRGMKLRLGFSIAIHSNPDILLLDEAIHVGDVSFQNKINMVLHAMAAKQKTIIITSHYENPLRQFCNRFLYIEHGSLIEMGSKKLSSLYFQRQKFRGR
jgi:lipopolysaccharide transport system ATP-binding protein